jgi:hypothetical protein
MPPPLAADDAAKVITDPPPGAGTDDANDEAMSFLLRACWTKKRKHEIR